MLVVHRSEITFMAILTIHLSGIETQLSLIINLQNTLDKSIIISHMVVNLLFGRKCMNTKRISKQAQRRAAAETASRKLFEHLIHLMHNSSRHHNCWIYHDFELMCLTRKNDQYDQSLNTHVTSSNYVTNLKLEKRLIKPRSNCC